MEAGTATGRPGAAEEPQAPDAKQLVDKAGDDKTGLKAVQQMDGGQRSDALAWFMEDSGGADGSALTQTFSINVAGPDESARLVNWTIRSLDMDEIDSIRQRARGGNRGMRRSGQSNEVNEMKAALGMVAAATVDPDLEQARQKKNAVSKEEVLDHRFRQKPGLILQISGKVLELSGYDEEDIQEAVAAGNS